jgi:hypothetical protein
MFDWGGWQTETRIRQGCAVATMLSREGRPAPYTRSAAKKFQAVLETFIHEVATFNLPTRGSVRQPRLSFRIIHELPLGYTGGTGSMEESFWSNFRWNFPRRTDLDVTGPERRHLRRAGLPGNNLSIFVTPEMEIRNDALQLEVQAQPLYDLSEPMHVEVKLKNSTDRAQKIATRLQPKDGMITFFIRRPNGTFVRYVPPVTRCKAPPDAIALKAGESVYESVLLSYGAKGFQFLEPVSTLSAHTLRPWTQVALFPRAAA